jgi:type I restriction enzyme S subunit
MSESSMKGERTGLVPRLRFPEFRVGGEWEEKVINDCFDVGSSKRVLQKDWATQGVPFYRTRELVSLSKGEPFSSEIFIPEDLFLSLSEEYGVPDAGDFLVSGVGTLGVGYQVRTGDRFYFKDGNVLWLALREGIESDYFRFCFESDYVQNQIVGSASKSTVGTYTITNAKRTKFWRPPDIAEQRKIAACLSSLDTLIAAQADKLDALKTHKKGLMQQLFPREGETVPRLRFPEFRAAGEWEAKELGPLTTKVGSGITPRGGNKNYKTEGHPFMRSQNVGWGELLLDDIVFIDTETHGSFDATEIQEFDVLLNITGASIGRSAIADSRIAGGNVNQHVCIIRTRRPKLSPVLLNQFLISEQGQGQIDSFQAGGNRQGLNFGQIRSFKIPMPPTDNEQQKIAACLSSLDTLVAAQADKLDALKTHKKGLMQQLFPHPEVNNT